LPELGKWKREGVGIKIGNYLNKFNALERLF